MHHQPAPILLLKNVRGQVGATACPAGFTFPLGLLNTACPGMAPTILMRGSIVTFSSGNASRVASKPFPIESHPTTTALLPGPMRPPAWLSAVAIAL
jgi:hypothetical protein